MKYLSPAEIHELLKNHGPQVLLDEYKDQLDSQGRQILEQAEAEEAQAKLQIQEMSATFRDGLPPVPNRPWQKDRPLGEGRRSPRRFYLWSVLAAACLFPLLFFWFDLPFRNIATRQTRTLRSPAKLEFAQRQLSDAWIQFARLMIQNSREGQVQDQNRLHRLAAFYLNSISYLDATGPSQKAEADALRQTAGLTPSIPYEPWQFDGPPPASYLKMADTLHEATSSQITNLEQGKHILITAYIEIADHFIDKAYIEKSKHRAAIANQWAGFFLELANITGPDHPEALIRLIRVKELLGKDAEAEALAERLNKILTRD